MGLTSDLPLYVAVHQGMFAKAGLKVELVRFTAANDLMSALVRGDLQGTGGIGPATLYSVESTAPGTFKLCAFAEETEEIYSAAIIVMPGSTITSIEDLRGKRIGTYTGSTQLLNVQLMLANALGSADAASIVQVSPALELEALKSGQFDALFTIEPKVTTATSTGEGRVVVANPRVKYILSPFPAAACALSARFLSENPDAASKVIAGYAEAVSYVVQRPANAKLVLPTYTPISPAIAAKSMGYAWYLPRFQHTQVWQELANLLYDRKLVRNRIPVPSLFLHDAKAEHPTTTPSSGRRPSYRGETCQ